MTTAHMRVMQLPDNPAIYIAIAIFALISLAAAQSKIVRRIVSLGFWLGTIAVVTILFAEQGRYNPTIAGVLDRLQLDRQEVVGGEVRVPLSPDGHFWVRATIGGVERRMLVDTGATVTAISEATAAAAGAELRRGVAPVIMQTANGATVARSATLRSFAVGPITARDLPVVVTPSLGTIDVLGMNFLMRLGAWRVEDRTLILVAEPGPR